VALWWIVGYIPRHREIVRCLKIVVDFGRERNEVRVNLTSASDQAQVYLRRDLAQCQWEDQETKGCRSKVCNDAFDASDSLDTSLSRMFVCLSLDFKFCAHCDLLSCCSPPQSISRSQNTLRPLISKRNPDKSPEASHDSRHAYNINTESISLQYPKSRIVHSDVCS